jgi:hypothetical protein
MVESPATEESMLQALKIMTWMDMGEMGRDIPSPTIVHYLRMFMLPTRVFEH